MSFNSASGFISTQNVTVTGAVTQGMTGISSGQTLVTAIADGVADGTTLYTVTAGKTFYCLGCFVATNQNSKLIRLLSNGVLVLWASSPASTGAQQTASGGIVFKANATQTITVTGGTGTANYAGIWGYEA